MREKIQNIGEIDEEKMRFVPGSNAEKMSINMQRLSLSAYWKF